jgi:uncharacterized membrane protein
MNKFLQEVVLPPHQAIRHVPITLFPVSLVFMILFIGQHSLDSLKMAYWCYLFGAFSTLPVGITEYLGMRRLKLHSQEAQPYLQMYYILGVALVLVSIVSACYFLMHSPVTHLELAKPFFMIVLALSLSIFFQGWVAAIMVYQCRLGIEGETC